MTKLHHIGIIIHDRELVDIWLALLNGEIEREYYVSEYQANCIFCSTGEGSPAIELILPSGGVLQKFNRGLGGIHHIALEVDSIDAVRNTIKTEYAFDLLEKDHVNAGPILINFLPPLLTRGVIIEYVQRN